MAATLKSNITAIRSRLRARAAALANDTAASIEVTVKSGMLDAKSGRTYRRKGKTGAVRTHRASAPGESPAVADKDYVKSIGVFPVGDGEVAVGSTDPKSPVLELGGGRVAARPHFGPAFDQAREDFESGLRGVFD